MAPHLQTLHSLQNNVIEVTYGQPIRLDKVSRIVLLIILLLDVVNAISVDIIVRGQNRDYSLDNGHGHLLDCILHTAYCILHTTYCMLHTVYCILYTAYCILHTAYCILHTAYSIILSIVQLVTVASLIYTEHDNKYAHCSTDMKATVLIK